MTARQRTVAVVGAGFSGTLAALHLLRHAGPGTRICLVEQSGDFGPGRAYATQDPAHLLNVHAARMGAFPDDPGHFLSWLRAQPGHERAGGHDFVPRRLYGAYLRQLLAAAPAAPRFERRAAQVTGLTPSGTLTLEQGASVWDAGLPPPGPATTLDADAVVLATGNFAPLPPPGIDPARLPPGIFAPDPWRPAAFANLPPDAPVLLVGAGLTAADAVLTLLDAGHAGPIHILSRHGLLPRPHAATPALPAAPDLPDRLLPLLHHVRRTVRGGAPWQSVIDALRPRTAALWQHASPAERARFLRHLRAWWDVHRHRLPPSTAARLDAARGTGQLRLHAGHIVTADPAPDGAVRVTYHPRAAATAAAFAAARIINCTGPASDYARLADPLIRTLLDSGLARPDPLHLGLDITESLALRAADGTPSTRFFALGPLLRATFWEMTSVPDLRVQAERLALALAA